jgi:hypothetical protein
MFFFAAVPMLLYRMLENHHHWKLSVAEFFGISVEMLIEVCQVLGTLTGINVELNIGFAQFLEVMNFFDIGAYVSVECLARDMSDPLRYWVIMAVIPLIIVVTWIEFLLFKILPVPQRFKWKTTRTWNLSMKIFNTIFVSQISIGVMPLQCFKHPNGVVRTVMDFPATDCSTGEYVPMLLGGLLSLFISALFLAYLTFEMWRAPRKLNSPNGKEYMEIILFSVEDFRSDMYWFNIPMKIQELLLGFVTLVWTSNARFQLSGFTSIFVLSLWITCTAWPFKPPILNLMLTVLYFLIALSLHLAGDQAPPPDQYTKDWSQALTFVSAFCGFMLMIAFIGCGICNRIFQKNQLYAITQLRYQPNFAEIATMWNNCAALNGDQLAAQLEFWEIGQIQGFEKILPVLSQQLEQAEWGTSMRFASAKNHAAMIKGMDKEAASSQDDTMAACVSIGEARQQQAAFNQEQLTPGVWSAGAIVQVSV